MECLSPEAGRFDLIDTLVRKYSATSVLNAAQHMAAHACKHIFHQKVMKLFELLELGIAMVIRKLGDGLGVEVRCEKIIVEDQKQACPSKYNASQFKFLTM